MDYVIKKLLPADLSMAKELIMLWQTEDGISDPTIPGDNYLYELLSKDTFHVFVAMDGQLVIGGLTAYELCMYKEEVIEMFLYEIGVNENYRQKGIATKLIESLKKICTAKEIKIIFVGTSPGNNPAKKLYRSSGGEMEDISWVTYYLDK